MESPRRPDGIRAIAEGAVVAADGLLFATPEYNNGIPGCQERDRRLSRPADDIPACSATGGGGDGRIAGRFARSSRRTRVLSVMLHVARRQWTGGRLLVSRAAS